MGKMPVVLLAGGRGTRLGEFTSVTPKSLIRIGPSPIIQHLIGWFAKYGHDEFYVLTGYLHEEIEKYFLQARHAGSRRISIGDDGVKSDKISQMRCTIHLINTGVDSGIAFRVQQAQEFIGDRPFILTYSDGLADVDLDELAAFHSKMKKSHGIEATLSAVQPSSRFGVVDMDGQGIVQRFREKPAMHDWVNMGFMVLEPSIFSRLSGISEKDMLEADIFPQLAQEGKIAAYMHKGEFKAMDSYKDYVELNGLWSSGKVFWKV